MTAQVRPAPLGDEPFRGPIGITRTATVLFVDVVESTRTRVRIGDGAADWRWLAIEHMLVFGVGQAGGRVLKSVGDGVVAVFESACSAFEAAVESMRSVMIERLRIGIATGDVALLCDDAFGTPAVIAARLCAIAEPGQILATQVAVEVAGTRSAVRPDDPCRRELRGLPEPVATVVIPWRHGSGDASPRIGQVTGPSRHRRTESLPEQAPLPEDTSVKFVSGDIGTV